MKRYLYFITIALAGLFVSACNNTEKPLDEADHYIDVVSESMFSVGYDEEIINVEIDANCKWNISKTDSNGEGITWIKTDVATGAGAKAFRIKVLKNKTEFERRGTVNIYSDQITAYIDITQAANPDPEAEPVPFTGYNFPAYEMFESNLGLDVTSGVLTEMDCDFANASVDGNVVKFVGGLEIEKTGDTPADFKMACPVHVHPKSYAGFQLGLGATFAAGESWIYKIPMNFALSGDLRFTYGSRKEGISDASAYKWSSDEGKTWNDVDKMETIKSDAAFKSVWFTIPEAQKVESEGSLWIKVTPTAAKVYIQNGIALERASASLSSIAPQDNSTVVISEGFDDIVEANASYITVPGFMKSATTGYWSTAGQTNAYTSTNPAVSYNGCFARPGFLQVGYSDEALPARCGWNGGVTLKVGARLAEMGITEKTAVKVSLKAAGMTNAYGKSCDAQLVIKSAGEVVASAAQLSMDKFTTYVLRVPDVDQNTVLEITSLTCEKPGDGTAATAYEAADYRFFIDDLLVEVAPMMTDMELTFDFSDASKMALWPTEANRANYAVDTPVPCVYELDGVNYTFILADPHDSKLNLPYFNTANDMNRLTVTTQRYLGFPVIDGYKLVKVSFVAPTEGTNCAISSDIASGTADPTFVEGGAKAKVTSFDLKSTEAGKQYYLKVWGAYAITSMTLNYTME